MLFGMSNGLPCDFDSFTWLLPGTLVDHQTNPDDPPPSLQPHYRTFITTTRRSRPPAVHQYSPPHSFSCLGFSLPQASVSTPARAITARGSHVSCQRLNRVRATSVPGNRQGSRQVSPWLFPGATTGPRLRLPSLRFDTSAVVHSRSPSRAPDASRAPFPWCSSPRLIHRSNPRWFTASPCRAAAEGLPPSPAQHRNHQRDLLQSSWRWGSPRSGSYLHFQVSCW